MTRHLFMIITGGPPADQAEAVEDWYVNRHMRDVLAVPGFTAGQRFRLAPDPEAGERFITIYEMECEDRNAVIAEVRRRAGTDLMPLFPDEHGGPRTTLFGEAVTDRMLSPLAKNADM
jgi:hypothetical protein